MSELPIKWSEANLAEVATILMGQSPPSRSYNGKQVGLPFYQGKAEFGEISPTPVKYCDAPLRVAEASDVVISVRAPVGPTNLLTERSCIGRGLAAVRPLDAIPSEYLLYYLRSIEDWLSNQGTGSTFTAIGRDDLEQLRVPVAPIEEQKRIVETLESALGKLGACQRRLDRIPTLLKRFRQSVLRAACSGRLTEDWRRANARPEDVEDSWKRGYLGDFLKTSPQNGVYRPQSDYGGGVPILRIDNFYDGVIAPWSKLKRLALDRSEASRYALSNGDIVINRVNSMRYLGKSGLVRDLDCRCVFESNMMRIQLRDTDLLPAYAIIFLNSPDGLKELRKNAKHAINQSSINQKDVESVELTVPLRDEQNEIVNRSQHLFELADQIEARYEKAKAQIDKLTPSILAKAFRGELVPQDPNDEPAEKLLERIRAERANQSAPANGKKKRRSPKRDTNRKQQKAKRM